MIKINLIEQKPFKMPIILGVDLSAVNLRLILAAVIVSYLPGIFLYPDWDEKVVLVEKKIKALNINLRKVRRKIKKNSKAKDELEAFNSQVEKLKRRRNYVTKIVNLRSNPKKLLERLAREILQQIYGLNISK